MQINLGHRFFSPCQLIIIIIFLINIHTSSSSSSSYLHRSLDNRWWWWSKHEWFVDSTNETFKWRLLIPWSTTTKMMFLPSLFRSLSWYWRAERDDNSENHHPFLQIFLDQIISGMNIIQPTNNNNNKKVNFLFRFYSAQKKPWYFFAAISWLFYTLVNKIITITTGYNNNNFYIW